MSYKDAPIIDSQGEQTNPGTSTVMADTGAITKPGFYEVLAIVNTTANAQFELQHRNSGNTGVVSDTAGVYCAANAPAEVKGLYFINENERVRVMMNAALTGDAWATLFVTRVQ